jgi:hypothetical protein
MTGGLQGAQSESYWDFEWRDQIARTPKGLHCAFETTWTVMKKVCEAERRELNGLLEGQAILKACFADDSPNDLSEPQTKFL